MNVRAGHLPDNPILNEIKVTTGEPDDPADLICAPLRTVNELLNWNLSTHPKWARKVIRMEKNSNLCALGKDAVPAVHGEWKPIIRCHKSSVPKTLFCHDYKGGYLEDSFVDGSDKYTEYRFFHWAGIDTFVYFSHNLVTIPPLSWINSAHRHGVKVLGTLITEWEDGMGIWNKILESTESIEQTVDNLVAISVYFGFEGYLLNIENEIRRSSINHLEYFVVSLRQKLADRVPGSELIWYDSVTVFGELQWQNQLNDKNKRWLDACDGIFLNYGWTEEKLRASLAEAGVRAHDVYVGVDVFGRGCLGGGGFNSSKAVKVARDVGLSVALFAPGWVHETQTGAPFAQLECLFWAKLWPWMFAHGPTTLPFVTSFCQGFGLAKYSRGEKVSGCWYNLALQAYQPSVRSDLSETCVGLGQLVSLPTALQRGSVEHYANDALEGGGCLRLQPPNDLTVTPAQGGCFHRLFVCHFETGDVLLVTFAWKAEGADTDSPLSLVLIVEDTCGRYSKIKLNKHPVVSSGVRSVVGAELAALGRECHLDLDLQGFNGWMHSVFSVELGQRKVVEIGAEIQKSVLLGQLRLLPIGRPAAN